MAGHPVRTNEVACTLISDADRSVMCIVDIDERRMIRSHHLAWNAEHVTFSNDGRWLAVAERCTIQVLASHDRAYPVKRRFNFGIRDKFIFRPFAEFSPDARWFLIAWGEAGRVAVHVVDPDDDHVPSRWRRGGSQDREAPDQVVCVGLPTRAALIVSGKRSTTSSARWVLWRCGCDVLGAGDTQRE